MAIFNVAFLNPKMRKQKGEGGGVKSSILSNNLLQLENDLIGKDGFLSQGDYDLLIDKTMKYRLSPGLTPSQQSTFDTKISHYERRKSIAKIDRSKDIGRMNQFLEKEKEEDVKHKGDKPVEFLYGRMTSLFAKMNDLQDAIDRSKEAGQDYYLEDLEYDATAKEYESKMTAFNELNQYAQYSEEAPNTPIGGCIAYIDSNPKGEIMDIDYGYDDPNKQGYLETNGMIDGCQIKGKANRTVDGENIFYFGGKTFSAPDRLMPDAAHPGQFKTERLTADLKTVGGAYTEGKPGYINFSNKGIEEDEEPGKNRIRIQRQVDYGGWGKSFDGTTVYRRNEKGGWARYINIDENNLPDEIPSLDRMMPMSEKYEAQIFKESEETTDLSEPIVPDEGFNGEGLMDIGTDGMPWSPGQEQTQAPVSQPVSQDVPMAAQARPAMTRTKKQPVEKASEGAMATAQRTVRGGIDYLKGMF